MKNRSAAIEMSIGTIIIIVLGVTMLILGMVLVRAVMCSAISLTDETGKKASAELEKYFEEKGEEVVCIGESGEIPLLPGAARYIYCKVTPEEEGKYSFSIKEYSSISKAIKETDIKKWIVKSSSSLTVSPGNTKDLSVANLNVPKNAPEGSIELILEVKKKDASGEEKHLYDLPLHFKVTRVGFIKSSIC